MERSLVIGMLPYGGSAGSLVTVKCMQWTCQILNI
ncbi:hypothetical protein RHECNPAF_9300161 [Rhizobium etli CNPAF512]|nr:hypothetical protein RHECNPAF_9300161 [Rhizobium etli CNPAF512]